MVGDEVGGSRSGGALRDMERSLDFISSTTKWTRLKPGHEIIYPFLKAHIGC